MQPTQAVSLLLSLLGIGSWALWASRNRKKALLAVIPLSWLIHCVVFYIVLGYWSVTLPGEQNTIINIWSAALRLHGCLLATITPLAIGRLYEQ